MREVMTARDIVFSSPPAATYGNPVEMPITEEPSARHPISIPTGSTKLHMEHMMEDFARGLRPAFRRRCATSTLPEPRRIGRHRARIHDPETHLIPLVLAGRPRATAATRSWSSATITRRADGTCIRDYIHVEDLADAHLRALRAAPDREGARSSCNLGTGDWHLSVLEVDRDGSQGDRSSPSPHAVASRRRGRPSGARERWYARAEELLGWTREARGSELDIV